MTAHPTRWLEDGTEEQRASVRADVLDFLRSGGVLTLEDWRLMTPLGRTLSVEAGRARDAERVEALVLAAAGVFRETRIARTVRDAADAGAAECAAGNAT